MEKVRSSKTARIVHQIKTAVRVLLTVQIKSLTAANLQIKAARRFIHSRTIPVGTDVITSLGKTTTFSRLSNGDIIKMIMEKDSSGEKVVVGVWIVS